MLNTMTPTETLEALGRVHDDARAAQEAARQALRTAVLHAVAAGMPESHAAKAAGVDRMTVRKWRQQ